MRIDWEGQKFWRFLPVLPLMWLVVQTAWVSDDAYITFRSIENLLHGYGPLYNVGERVQTFTHPLWFLLQTLANLVIGSWANNPFGTGQLYFVNVLLSILISGLAALAFCVKVASSVKGALLGMVILTLSKAFVDFSTSGLENPLTHVLVLAFVGLYLSGKRQRPFRYFGLASLAALAGFNRLDLLLLFLPALALTFWEDAYKCRALGASLLGFLPLIAWEIFSTFYYGSPFPNTALAKLNTGISPLQLAAQGGHYYLSSLSIDPITLLTIAAAVAWALTARDRHQLVIAVGIVLYLAYIDWIGGDFMSGRYFSAPLVAAAAMLSRFPFRSWKAYGVALSLALIVGIAPVFMVPRRGLSFGEDTKRLYVFVDDYGISDERRFYFDQMGFLTSLSHGAPAGFASGEWIYHSENPARVQLVGTLGVAGFNYGPDVYVIDRNGLADPLLGHLPLLNPGHWRIGHFRHMIPEGYLATLSSGKNQIRDPGMALYYDQLSFVKRGALWDSARLVEIWNLNTGKYDYLLPNAPPEPPAGGSQ